MSLDPTGLIGIGLGVPGLIEVCLKLGRKLYQLSNDYKSADEITTEIVLKLRVHWANMLDILENLDRISSRLGVQLEAEIEQMLELLRDLLRKAFEKISRLRITGTTVQPGGLVWSKAVLEGLLSKSQEWESMISKRLVIIALSKLLDDSTAVDQWQRPLTRLLDPIAATPPVDIKHINADDLIFQKLPCSEIMYARGTTRYLIDKLPFNPPSLKSRTNEKFKVFQSGAYYTVRMLQHADPRLMSIL